MINAVQVICLIVASAFLVWAVWSFIRAIVFRNKKKKERDQKDDIDSSKGEGDK